MNIALFIESNCK